MFQVFQGLRSGKKNTGGDRMHTSTILCTLTIMTFFILSGGSDSAFKHVSNYITWSTKRLEEIISEGL